MAIEVERFSRIPWQEIGEFASQKLVDDGEKRVRLLKLAAGFQEQEWCTRGHTGYVIDGSIEMEFEDGSRHAFSVGDALLLSKGTPHKARTGSGTALLFLVDDI